MNIEREKKMLFECLSAFNDENDNVAQTLFDVYPDEMLAIAKLLKNKSEAEVLLEEAGTLVGNPGTNISGSCDVACMEWQEKYEKFKSLK